MVVPAVTKEVFPVPTEQMGDSRPQARNVSPPPPFHPAAGEQELVAALRRRDEAAFSTLVTAHHTSLLRVARMYVNSPAVCEEVVQETWLGVLKGLDRFEGRCSLKTWIFQIASEIAPTRARREGPW